VITFVAVLVGVVLVAFLLLRRRVAAAASSSTSGDRSFHVEPVGGRLTVRKGERL